MLSIQLPLSAELTKTSVNLGRLMNGAVGDTFPISMPENITIKVSDDAINSYVKEHAAAYQKDEETRSIAYVSFSATPSSSDSAAVLNEAVSESNSPSKPNFSPALS